MLIKTGSGERKLLNKLIPLTNRPPFLAVGPINVGRESLTGLLQRVNPLDWLERYFNWPRTLRYVGLKGVIGLWRCPPPPEAF